MLLVWLKAAAFFLVLVMVFLWQVNNLHTVCNVGSVARSSAMREVLC